MSDPMYDYIHRLYEKNEHTDVDPPSLDSFVIKERKALLDAAFAGDLKAQQELAVKYGLTMIYRKGTTIYLKGNTYVEKN